MDAEIEKFLKRFNFDTIIIFSDHGFESRSRYNLHTNTWLEQEGYLRMIGGTMMSRLYDLMKRMIPMKLIANIRIMIKKMESSKGVERPKVIPGVDWSRTKAYQSCRWGINIVRENLEGGEYEPLREEIIQKLREMKFDNKAVMREVYKREEVFSGKYTEKIPDIVFSAGRDFYTSSFPSIRIIEEQKEPKDGITGEHNSIRDGIFIAFGKDIKNGFEIEGARILDVAPTVLHIFGAPIPEDMDGRVLTEIFRDGSEPAEWEIKYQKVSKEKERISRALMKIKNS